jgi:hypothetical protein
LSSLRAVGHESQTEISIDLKNTHQYHCQLSLVFRVVLVPLVNSALLIPCQRAHILHSLN